MYNIVMRFIMSMMDIKLSECALQGFQSGHKCLVKKHGPTYYIVGPL